MPLAAREREDRPGRGPPDSRQLHDFVERLGLVDYWKQYGYPDRCRPGTGTVAIVCAS